MPGIVIHLAIGKQYIKKHKKEIINEKKFLKGSIAPDLNSDMTETTKEKNKTHYGKWKNYERKIYIDQFLKDKKVNMESDYWRGYFLHLLTDYYFANIDFAKEFEAIVKNQDDFHKDWDCLNKDLMNQYPIEPIKSLEKYMSIVYQESKYLKPDKVVQFIEKMSNMKIKKQIKIIEEKGMEGLK